MWNLILIAVAVVIIIYCIKKYKTGSNGIDLEGIDMENPMLSGSIPTSALPEDLQVIIKKFVCDPFEEEKVPIPDDYIAGQYQTDLLKRTNSAMYNDLKRKDMIVDLDFTVNGRNVKLESAYINKAPNQNKCGSCWAFAIAASLTDRIRLYSRKGKSQKFFCYQGASDNPSACNTYCDECQKSGCCKSLFCNKSFKSQITRTANSGWVEVIPKSYLSSSSQIGNYSQGISIPEQPQFAEAPPRPSRRPVQPLRPQIQNLRPRPTPTPVQPVRPTPTPVQPVRPTPTPVQPVRPTPTPVQPVRPTPSNNVFIPELLTKQMIWPRDPTKHHSYDDIIKLQNSSFAGNNVYEWTYDAISPYYLAACNISNIAWELDSETAKTIGKEVKALLSTLTTTLKNQVCSGGIPIFACIYMMLQGGLALSDHNPFLRFKHYQDCKSGKRKDRCQEIVSAYEGNFGKPSEQALRQLPDLQIMYICEDCDANKLPYYKEYEQCSETTDNVRRYIQSQYYCAKTVYNLDKNNVKSIQRDVLKYGSVVLMMVVDKNFYRIGQRDAQGRFVIDPKSYIYNGNVPASSASGQHGLHAITIVGWIKNPQVKEGIVWVCRNSWGQTWGNKGFCLMSNGYTPEFEVMGMEPFEFYDERDFISPDRPVMVRGTQEQMGSGEQLLEFIQPKEVEKETDVNMLNIFNP